MKMPGDYWVKVSKTVDRMIWRSNPNIVTVWLWILTHVNGQDRLYYGGGKIPAARGQVVTTMTVIAEACGISYPAVRHAFRVLSSTRQITIERVGNYLRISYLPCVSEATQPKKATTDLTTDPATDPTTDLTADLRGVVEPTASTLYGWSDEGATTDPTTDLTTDPTTDQPFPYMYRRDIDEIKNTSTLSLSPSQEEVQTYFRERGYRRDPRQFYAYNAMRGWGRIRDWRAAADLWESHGDPKPTHQDQEESSSIDWDSVHQMVLEVPVFKKGGR